MAMSQEAISALTIVAKTEGVDKATAALQGLSAAQEGVAVTAQKQEKATQSLQSRLNSIQRQYDAVYRAEQALARVERDLANAQGQGLITNQRRLELLSLAAEKHGLATAAINREISATERLSNVQRAQAAANQNLRGVGPINTANIAAQFQDIGVTAAMGMNPLQIALQQGTQLSAVLGPMGAAGAVRSLGAALASVVNPVSLITLGLTAAAAVAIQWAMSTLSEASKVEKSLEAHKKLIDEIADTYPKAAEAAKAYEKEASRLPGSVAMADTLRQQREEAALYGAQLESLTEQLQRAGQMTITYGRDGAYTFGLLAERIASGEINANGLNEALGNVRLNPDTPENARRFAEYLQEAVKEAVKLEAAVKGTAAAAGALPWARSPLDPLGGFAMPPPGLSEEGMMTQRWQEAERRRQEELKRGSIGIPTPTPRPNDIERLDWAASESRSTRSATADFDRSIEQIRARTAAMEAEAAVVGMSTFASAKYLATQRLEAEARKDAIGLTPTRIALIDAETSAYARRVAATEAAVAAEKEFHEEMAFRRDLMGGALNDVRGALADGKLEWQELGNVAINALNKILDKLQNELLDAIFNLNKAAGAGGGGSSLLGSIMGLLGGGGGFSGFEMAWTAAVPGLWAKGGAFDGGKVMAFAKGGAVANSNIMPFAAGGAFTNSIVDRPTLFPMANGAGLMGEAGPEAIMPLKRGPDGRLGVASNGGGQQTVYVTNTFNIDASNAQPGVGAEIKAAVKDATRDMTPAVVKALREIKRKGIAV